MNTSCEFQRAKQAMTGDYEVDIQMLTEKLELLCKQIEPHGKVVDFLENPEVSN